MGNRVFCDLCKSDIDSADLRQIDFWKVNEGKALTPIHTSLEICAICMDAAHKKVVIAETSLKPKGPNAEPSKHK